MVKVEKLYNLHDKFKRVTNYKTSSSSMQYEVVNFGFEHDPNNLKSWSHMFLCPNKLPLLVVQEL